MGPRFMTLTESPARTRELQTCPPSARRVGAQLAATPRFRTRNCTNTERNMVPSSDEAGKLTGGESLANSDT